MKSKVLTLAVWAGVIALVAFVAPAFILPVGLAANAKRTIYQRVLSPDGARQARVQFDDGGALDPFRREVYVKREWVGSDSPWYSCRAFTGFGEGKVLLHWINNDTLLIRHSYQLAEVETAADHCGAVRVLIQPAKPD